MFSFELLTSFLGWCSLINICLLALSTFLIRVFMEPISSIHSKMFAVEKSQLPMTYFWYLAYYKIVILVFNLVPYTVLRIFL